MTRFSYRARDRYGVLSSGELEAESQSAAALRLEKIGLTPVSITEIESFGVGEQLTRILARFRRVNPVHLVVFTRQLASILDAGVPLTESLEAVGEQIQDPLLRVVILDVKRDIQSGSTFSDSLEKYQRFFSPLIVNMIRAGEKGGILPQVLDRISNLLEKDIETMDKIKTAIRYPVIVLVVLAGAFVAMTVFVIPRFAAFFAAFKAELPLPTRILINIHYVLTTYWYWFVFGFALVLWSFRKILETERGRYNWDKFILSIPVFGPLFIKIYLSRFGRMFSSMLSSGIPVLDALTITSTTVENKIISRTIIDIRDEVSKGKSLNEPMRGCQFFPPIAVSMVAIGEKAGTLESMLEKMSDYFDREADYTIKNLTPLIEPFLIFGLAALVLLFAMGIFLPMWDLVRIYKSF